MKRRLLRATVLTLQDLGHVGLEVADECYELLGEAWRIAHFILEKLWELFEYVMGALPRLISKGL